MLDALRAAGARDYSIFLRGDDLFAYLVVDDFARVPSVILAASDVNARWQAEMGDLIDPLTDPATGLPPDDSRRSSTSTERPTGRLRRASESASGVNA